MTSSFLLCIISLVIIVLTQYFIYKWRNPKCSGKLVPGSSGLPLIGETLDLFIPNYTLDIQPFIKNRLQRYGSLFRTNIAGRNVVISADPEFNRFIFQQEEKLVMRWYLSTMETLFTEGDSNDLISHKYTRNLALSHFGIECLRSKLISQFEQLVLDSLDSWSIHDSVEFKSASVAMFASFGAKVLYNCDPETLKELTSNYVNVSKGLISLPLNIPGTSYRKCLQDKEKLLEIIKDIVRKRLASTDYTQEDLLANLIKDMSDKDLLRAAEFIPEYLFGISFAVFETIPSVLTFALKFISENPAVLQELTAEHDQILERRNVLDSPVTWAEYKSMNFTHQVVNETLRLGNTLPGILRKAMKDIQVKGYTIPAGWGIMVCYSAQHLDPNIYEDPLTFNPWRWKDAQPEFISKNLVSFGGGMKQCAGADYSRASMAIFLHVLVTKYRWSVVKGGDLIQNPMLHFKNGLHISVSKKSN